jgi:large subunit ribosomal protein L24
MRKSWSSSWKASGQPRKQRKYVYNAPLHVRGKLLSAHLSKALRKELGRRSAALRKGDEVTVVKGEFAGRSGKITRLDRGSLRIFVDGIKMKKVSGQEIEAPVVPSNVLVTKLEMADKLRIASLKRPAKLKAAGMQAGK